ncbi:MAG: UpxY family transcription antiterminator [Candidatus Acidiferrales bacterium]
MQSDSPGALPEAWYAVYTKHQHEKSARDQLSKKGFEVLLPLYRSARRWKDRSKIIDAPLFPCYLFLRARLERKLEVLQTPGVFWIVGNGGQAAPVPECDIDAIRKITQSDAEVQPHPFLRCGDRARIHSGPLAGVEGILIRVKNNYRIVLSVELLKQGASLEVDPSIIERAPASSRSELSSFSAGH